MGRKLLLLVLFLVFLLSVAGRLNASTPSHRPEKYAFANVTQVNVTIAVYSCKGAKIDPSFLDPLSVQLRGLNFTKEVKGKDVFTIQVPTGSYNITVLYLGTPVYFGNLSLNNSTQVNIKANITKVTFRAVGLLSGQGLPGYVLTINSPAGYPPFNSGASDSVSVWLPYGTLKYKVVYQWNNYGNATVSDSLLVSCDTSLVVVKLPVWNILVFYFRLPDGSTVQGFDGAAEIYYLGTKLGTVDFKTQDKIILQGALLGSYTVQVYLHGKKIAEKTILVDERSWNYTIGVNIISMLTIRLFDINNQPLISQDLAVTLTTPLGAVLNYTLGNSHVLTIYQTVPGDYTIRLTSAIIGLIYEGRISISSNNFDLQLSVVPSSIVFKPEGTSFLPQGIAVDVFYVYSDREILLYTTPSLSGGGESTKRVPLGVLPVGGNLKIVIRYAGLSYTTFLKVGATGTLQADIPVYDVTITVVDKKGNPLSGCYVNVTAGNLALSSKLRDGQAFFQALPQTDAHLTLKCSGVILIDRVFSVTKGNLSLTAPITEFKVTVKSWFDRPVVGAKVTLTLYLGNKSVFSVTDTTDQSGSVVMKGVPVASNGDLVLRVDYGAYVYSQRLAGDEKEIPVFLDILVDTPFFKLSMFQSVVFVLATLILTVISVFLLKRYESMAVFKNMFEVGAGEGEEKESLIEKLRKFFRRREKEEREEEESIFF
ncbi:MAG: hypothetical protein ABWK01_05280 [Infirmifilum sp.]